MKPDYYIVTFDDDMGMIVPLSWNEDCEGALCCGVTVALFESKSEARKAIAVSTRFAQLRQAQGKAVNDDFTTGLKNIRIVGCFLKGGSK